MNSKEETVKKNLDILVGGTADTFRQLHGQNHTAQDMHSAMFKRLVVLLPRTTLRLDAGEILDLAYCLEFYHRAEGQVKSLVEEAS